VKAVDNCGGAEREAWSNLWTTTRQRGVPVTHGSSITPNET
jgi:hypothetical protein